MLRYIDRPTAQCTVMTTTRLERSLRKDERIMDRQPALRSTASLKGSTATVSVSKQRSQGLSISDRS